MSKAGEEVSERGDVDGKECPQGKMGCVRSVKWLLGLGQIKWTKRVCPRLTYRLSCQDDDAWELVGSLKPTAHKDRQMVRARIGQHLSLYR